MTAYSVLTDVSAGGPIMVPGDNLVSQSGVYFGTLTSDGQFGVVQGSSVQLDGAPANKATWISNPPATSSQLATGTPTAQVGAGYFLVGIPSSNGTISVLSSNPSPGGYPPSTSAFASVSDAGAFTVTTGTPNNPGTTVFSAGGNNPVTSLSLSSINYNLSAAKLMTSQVGGPTATSVCNNLGLPTAITCNPTLSLAYTQSQTFTWNLSEAVTAGVSSTTSVSVPGLASESATLNLSQTTTISQGKSTTSSTTQTFSQLVNIPTPGYSEYEGAIIATQGTYQVPYTFTGVATYKSGTSAAVQGSGTFDGSDTTAFDTTTTCLIYNGGACPPVPAEIGALPSALASDPAPIPEPPSLPLLPVALLVTTVLQGIRAARRKASVRGVAAPRQAWALSREPRDRCQPAMTGHGHDLVCPTPVSA